MAKRPSKNICNFFGCLNKISCIILDAYKSYINMPQEPAPDRNSKVNIAKMRAHYAAHYDALGQFHLLNQFRVALPVDLQWIINLQPLQNWIWIKLSSWPPSRPDLKRKQEIHQGCTLSKQRKGRTLLRQSPKLLITIQKDFNNNNSKIVHPRITGATLITKTTTVATIKPLGDQKTLSTMLTKTR